jgi:hypothetical protein
MKAKGKAHMCFPNRRLFQSETPLQAVLSMPRLNIIIWVANVFFQRLSEEKRLFLEFGDFGIAELFLLNLK